MNNDLAFNLDVKARFGRLLAGENLSVDVRPELKTAQFDLRNRRVSLPLLQGASEAVWNTYVAHEMAHALWSPLAGIMEAAKTIRFDVLNIVEDVRIEKLIKREYPGLVPSFIKGSNEIFAAAGFKFAEVPDMLIHDRVNVHFKLGDFAGAVFHGLEKDLVAQLEKMETFEDALKCAAMLQALLKSEAESKYGPGALTEGQPGDEEGDGGEGEGQPGQGKGKPGKGKGKSQPGEGDGEPGEGDAEGEGQGGKPKDSDGKPANGAGRNHVATKMEGTGTPKNKPLPDGASAFHAKNQDQTDLKAPISKTYEMSEGVTAKMAGENVAAERIKYVPLNWENFVIPAKPTMDQIFAACDDNQLFGRRDRVWSEDTHIKGFIDRVKVASNMMIREFDQRKSADQYARASVAKTGQLNTNKLWSAAITEDIFKRNTVFPIGKSHGFVLIIDWSGSMDGEKAITTMTQAATVATFAKRLAMPFKVLLFSDNSYALSKLPQAQKWGLHGAGYYGRGNSNVQEGMYKGKPGDMGNTFDQGRFALIELANNEMAMTTIHERLAKVAFYDNRISNMLGKGGTPLAESIYASIEMAKDLKERWGVQFLHTMVMTDGAGSSMGVRPATQGAQRGYRNSAKSQIVGFPDGREVVFQANQYTGAVRNQTSLLMNLYRFLVDGSFIFFLVDDNGSDYLVRQLNDQAAHEFPGGKYASKGEDALGMPGDPRNYGVKLTSFSINEACVNEFAVIGGFSPDMRLTARTITVAERKNKIKTRTGATRCGDAAQAALDKGYGIIPLYATGADVAFVMLSSSGRRSRRSAKLAGDERITAKAVAGLRDATFAKALMELIS